MSKRRKSREAALQALYQLELNPDSSGENVSVFYDNFRINLDLRNFASELYRGVKANRDKIDELIESSSENWRIERMAKIDLNILRLAIYEIMYLKDIPISVTINEAVEIGKKFGSEDTPAFLNGILDHLVKTESIRTAREEDIEDGS